MSGKTKFHTSRFFFLAAACALGLGISGLAVAASSDDANDIDWKKGVWSELVPNLGTYNYDKVLKDPRVKKEIDALLKGQKLDLAKQFEVTSPIGFESDCLVLQGNPAHMGDTKGIYMNACISQGNVYIAVFDGGKITVYSKDNDFQYLPNGMRAWIYLQSDDKIDLTNKPSNVQMMVQAK